MTERWRHRVYRRRPMPSPVLFGQTEIVARIEAVRRQLAPDRCPTGGGRAADRGGSMDMDTETFERIAARVHEGWAAEKLRQGFADHVLEPYCSPRYACDMDTPCHRPGCELPPEKHHADMLPYDDLAENVKEYDRATVRAVLVSIEAAGLKIVSCELAS